MVLTPVIPALRRLKQEDVEFEARLGYMVRCCLKRKGREKKRSRFGPMFIIHPPCSRQAMRQ
jgi:hypothetical protein